MSSFSPDLNAITNQTLSITGPDGPVEFTLADLNYYILAGASYCINEAAQIGATAVALLVLVLLSRPEKRRSAVYGLNLLSLICNLIRMVCSVVYYTSAFYSPYAVFTTDYSGIPRHAYATSIAANTFAVILLIIIEASLVFQVRVATSTAPALQRFWITVGSVVVALTAIGVRFAATVVGNILILGTEFQVNTIWLVSASHITTSMSIVLFCAVFVWKLAVAIKRQRKLGIKKFGPMHAIMIMGCQTLFIPAIFAIFQYIGPPSELQPWVLTLTAIFLPMSAMWASQTLENVTNESRKKTTSVLSGKRNLIASPTTTTTSATSETELKSGSSRKGSRYTASDVDDLEVIAEEKV